MVLNAAVQMLREAEELKQKILKFNSGTSMLQDKSLWATQQQLQKVYQKVLELDLDYALEKKVEQDLWNVGFKQQIEALQAISRDRKNPLRSEAQSMLSWVLQASAGFYLCLLHQICTTFKLDLPFRRRASLLGVVEGWEASPATGVSAGVVAGSGEGAAAARYACQHCLVHLGDLARYRQQLRVAHTFYRHALAVSVHSGQPYNQLALVSWRRGRRLAALYWHVRSLLVRAPFPPAPANLARTLAAAASRNAQEAVLPVLPGVTADRPGPVAARPGVTDSPDRLDAHSYVNELVRAVHYLHSVEQLETAAELVKTLSTSLSPLIATDSFDSMTLIKMACVLIWLVQSTTEDFAVELSALSEEEATAARLAASLAEAVVLALLLPAYTCDEPPLRPLPALKVWLQWASARKEVAREWGPALWAALAHQATCLAPYAHTHDTYDSVPLPEDEELNGFLPLEESFKDLKFNNQSSWDASKAPDAAPLDDELGARARRVRRLVRTLAELQPERLRWNTGAAGAAEACARWPAPEPLQRALAALAAAPPPAAPVVISEADFREKVREKRVGILKPQGSLERAREERALACAHDEPAEVECSDEASKSDDKKEIRKSRVNIAMAAIMRKQEETNKQVKFITPPPTPDSVGEVGDNTSKDDKPKIIQPKPMKSLANIPIGRKTGGILSLKDKSAGYPHLQNPDPEPKKAEKDEKKDAKSSQVSNPNSQNFQPKREQATSWPALPAQSYTDSPRMTFQKNYGIQNSGIIYNPNYQASVVNNQGIRLPVVNPKEIDVRTAALQKQSSRQELFQDGNKFGNQGYPMTGDKKNFLSDLPPRFANQYRYWQNAQENQYNDNKFRDDSPKNVSPFNAANAATSRQNWPTPANENFQQPISWWKPENQPNFNPQNFSSTPMNLPNFYSSVPSNMSNPYTNVAYNQIQGQNLSQNLPNMGQNLSQNIQSKPESLSPTYVQTAIAQPQLQTLQGLVSSPNFNSTLNNFAPFNAPVSYDSSMYPQFNKIAYQPLQINMLDKQNFQGQGTKELDVGLNFGSNVLDVQQRNLNFNETYGTEGTPTKSSDNTEGAGAGEAAYSLFSAAPDSWRARRPPPSLWSGPGPSPLERLLEQQKQMKQPPAPH